MSSLHIVPTIVPIPFYDDNYAWLISDGESAVVVDPGHAAPVIDYCQTHELRLTGILLTHHHADHVGGVDALARRYRGRNLRIIGPAGSGIQGITHPVGVGDVIHFAAPKFTASVIGVPGHTLDHIAYFQTQDSTGVPHLFCGDTLFASGCGRLFEGTPQQMLASLQTLAKLPPATLVHCAHEYTLSNIRFSLACEPDNPAIAQWHAKAAALRHQNLPTLPTTMGHELAVNPFFRVDNSNIRQTLQAQFNTSVPDALATFTLLRRWKDHFVPDDVLATLP